MKDVSPEDLLNAILKRRVEKHQFKAICEGIVKEVTENTCTVQIEEGPLLPDVRLQAIEDAVSSFIRVKPKVDSVVLIGLIENLKSEYAVLQCSEIDEAWIKIGSSEYKINTDGHLIKNGNDEMWDAVNLLFESLSQIIILKGRNPDWVKFNQAKNKFKNIFNGS